MLEFYRQGPLGRFAVSAVILMAASVGCSDAPKRDEGVPIYRPTQAPSTSSPEWAERMNELSSLRDACGNLGIDGATGKHGSVDVFMEFYGQGTRCMMTMRYQDNYSVDRYRVTPRDA